MLNKSHIRHYLQSGLSYVYYDCGGLWPLLLHLPYNRKVQARDAFATYLEKIQEKFNDDQNTEQNQEFYEEQMVTYTAYSFILLILLY